LLRDRRAGTTLVAAALIPVMMLTGVILHDVAALYGTRNQAQTAADAAAKAAGLELSPYFGVGNAPRDAAREYAARNGAELLECSIGGEGRFVWITVKVSRKANLLLLKVGEARVSATARCYLDLSPDG
jgi:secretion/DNA translocation related TadE-like protein